MERKLASIQRVKRIDPIEGRDKIVLATVLGWHVIVRKDEIKEGDLVVYIETDSILPDSEAFKDIPEKKRRIRMMKMAGVYSQGICFPLSILPEWNYEEGDDVTELLGIKKYEPDERNGKGAWYHHQNGPAMPKKWWARFRIARWFWKKFIYKPDYADFPKGIVPKTDECRVQLMQDILDRYKEREFTWTEKIDGSSITVWLDETHKLHVCSRNREILTHDDFMFQTAEEQLGRKIERGYVYQGEIVGPRIQQNKYGLEKLHIYIYNVWNTTLHRYLTPVQMARHCAMNGIDVVPYADTPYKNAFVLGDSIDALVEMSKGLSVMPQRTKGTPREGIVIRPLEYLEEPGDDRFVGGRLSFKAINPDFMIKYKL